MEPRTDTEQAKDNTYDDEAPALSGQRVLFPCALRKLPEAFGLSASKSWYPLF